MSYPLPWFPLSNDPNLCIRRTARGCRPYWSSLLECNFVAVEVVGLLAAFAYSSAQGVVGVDPSFFTAVFLKISALTSWSCRS